MPDRSAVAYLYDGSLEGLFTAIFEAYAHRPMPALIASGELFQPQFGLEARDIPTDPAKVDRVTAGIRRTMGEAAYEKIWLTFLSEQADRAQWIYRYVQLGMEQGRRIHQLLTADAVIPIETWSRRVSNEVGRMHQFVRFSERQGGVYYAGIRPDYAVLPLIMPFFVDRLRIQPFVLHDKRRELVGVFDTREWMVADAASLILPEPSTDERDYQRLWREFYRAVAIRERVNPTLRRQHMPKKYWSEILEMQPELRPESAGKELRVGRGDQPADKAAQAQGIRRSGPLAEGIGQTSAQDKRPRTPDDDTGSTTDRKGIARGDITERQSPPPSNPGVKGKVQEISRQGLYSFRPHLL